jgi:hypothetical protein
MKALHLIVHRDVRDHTLGMKSRGGDTLPKWYPPDTVHDAGTENLGVGTPLFLPFA